MKKVSRGVTARFLAAVNARGELPRTVRPRGWKSSPSRRRSLFTPRPRLPQLSSQGRALLTPIQKADLVFRHSQARHSIGELRVVGRG